LPCREASLSCFVVSAGTHDSLYENSFWLLAVGF